MADHCPQHREVDDPKVWERNWERVGSIVESRIEYDKIATRGDRRDQGIHDLSCRMANAFPDSRSRSGIEDFGNTEILDLRWTGTHEGNIEKGGPPGGEIIPTGRRSTFRKPRYSSSRAGVRHPRVCGNETVELRGFAAQSMSISHYFDRRLEKQLERSPE